MVKSETKNRYHKYLACFLPDENSPLSISRTIDVDGVQVSRGRKKGKRKKISNSNQSILIPLHVREPLGGMYTKQGLSQTPSPLRKIGVWHAKLLHSRQAKTNTLLTSWGNLNKNHHWLLEEPLQGLGYPLIRIFK